MAERLAHGAGTSLPAVRDGLWTSRRGESVRRRPKLASDVQAMANDRLRDAMLAARLDVEQLADAVDVDPRTVERWLGGRRPYRRLRWAVAAALGVDERAIWPDAASRQTENWQADELVEIYGYRADLPTERWSARRRGERGDRPARLRASLPLRGRSPARRSPRGEGERGMPGAHRSHRSRVRRSPQGAMRRRRWVAGSWPTLPAQSGSSAH